MKPLYVQPLYVLERVFEPDDRKICRHFVTSWAFTKMYKFRDGDVEMLDDMLYNPWVKRYLYESTANTLLKRYLSKQTGIYKNHVHKLTKLNPEMAEMSKYREYSCYYHFDGEITPHIASCPVIAYSIADAVRWIASDLYMNEIFYNENYDFVILEHIYSSPIINRHRWRNDFVDSRGFTGGNLDMLLACKTDDEIFEKYKEIISTQAYE